MVVDVPVTKEDVDLFFGLSYYCAAVEVTDSADADLQTDVTADAAAEVTACGLSYFSSAVEDAAATAADSAAKKFALQNGSPF